MLLTSKMTYIIVTLNDVRECRKEGDFFVHLLNSAWRIHKDDERIIRVAS